MYGTIETFNDMDWFAVQLTANTLYVVTQRQMPLGSIFKLDSYLRVFSASGVELFSDDDSGSNRNAIIQFRPTISGTYYVSAESAPYTFVGELTGPYELKIEANYPPAVYASASSNFSTNIGRSFPISSLFTAVDSGGFDTIARYKFFEPAGTGYLAWTANSAQWSPETSILTIDASELDAVRYVAESAGVDGLRVAAFDGYTWGPWTDIPVTVTRVNQPPVVTGYLKQVGAADSVAIANLFTAGDPDVNAGQEPRLFAGEVADLILR